MSKNPVRAGRELPCSPGRIHRRRLASNWEWNVDLDLGVRYRFMAVPVLRVLDGPQADWFPAEAFLAGEITVTSESNRMGLRLQGEPLPVPARELDR